MVRRVADLIEASSAEAARSAMRSLSGVFSEQIHALVNGLIDLRMFVEATLDFPEEDIEFLENHRAASLPHQRGRGCLLQRACLYHHRPAQRRARRYGGSAAI